jgi:hypothetical protein
MAPRARKLHKGERERTGDDDSWRRETKAASSLAGENLVVELQEVCNGRAVGCGGDDAFVGILGGLTLAAVTLWKAYVACYIFSPDSIEWKDEWVRTHGFRPMESQKKVYFNL